MRPERDLTGAVIVVNSLHHAGTSEPTEGGHGACPATAGGGNEVEPGMDRSRSSCAASAKACGGGSA